ncbi:hypothetical protein H0H93_000513 [Arthromyces matolae]|nr:hypothetical protein H0H93_000513 [Arthromyces matolae]
MVRISQFPIQNRYTGLGPMDSTSPLTTISSFFAQNRGGPVQLPEDIQQALETAASYLRNHGSNSSAAHTIEQPNNPPTQRQTSHAPSSPSTPIRIERNVQINRVTTLDVLYVYEEGSIVEFPETSHSGNVGHLFTLNSSHWYDPTRDFAYSTGPPRGASQPKDKVYCSVLTDEKGVKVPCRSIHTTCQGCKICPYTDPQVSSRFHCFASRNALAAQLNEDLVTDFSPRRLLFEKTLAYYGAILKHGCGGPPCENTLAEADTTSEQHARWITLREIAARGHDLKQRCLGRIVLDEKANGTYFIRCEHYNTHGNRDHLIDHDIGSGLYDLTYLIALFTDDQPTIERIEGEAENGGYGPRSPCRVISNGILELAMMQHLECSSKFRVFEPLESHRNSCRKVLVVCSGRHYHPYPLLTRTPPRIHDEILSILKNITHDLPDLTPRRFLRHPVTTAYLRSRFPQQEMPTLVDLHPSLANRDHLRSYISKAQTACFPHGTGWEGILYMKSLQDADTAKVPYIRIVEELKLDSDDEDDAEDDVSDLFRVIICMTPEGSRLLSQAHFIQSDIGFKRIIGFQEFELGGLDMHSRTSIVYSRIYLNRQTAAAHKYIFQKIDELICVDTGSRLRWRHLHAQSVDDYIGILQIAADQHGGQAKGLGLYLQDQAQVLPEKYDFYEKDRLLCDLSPYDHLRRVFRLCAVHVMRNIKTSRVSEEVRNKMRSLICVTHDNWEGTLNFIQTEGGKAGQDWVADKMRSKFAFPGMCWEKSLIPLQIWQTGDSNSNIIEGLHADVNREGTACTLVGGLMKGNHYDTMKLMGLKTHRKSGIRPSYRHGQLSETAIRKLIRKRRHQHNALTSQDDKIRNCNKQLATAHQKLKKAEERLHLVMHTAEPTSIDKITASWTRARNQFEQAYLRIEI